MAPVYSWTNSWSSSPMAARPVTEDNGDELPCEESWLGAAAPGELPGELLNVPPGGRTIIFS